MLLTLLSLLLLLITLPTFLELLLLLIGDYRFKAFRTAVAKKPSSAKRVVIIPAHNEEQHIGSLLEKLTNCKECFDVVVVADNCDDKTADIVRNKGFRVEERHDSSKKGKQFALQMIFEKLLKENYEWLAVLDADAIPNESFFEEINQHIDMGFLAFQASYALLMPKKPSWADRWSALAFGTFNLIHLRGRSGLDLSCGIFGNGFVLHRSLIEAIPYAVDSIVEDLLYHIRIVQLGKKVKFLAYAKVYAQVALTQAGRTTQQSRWIGGRLDAMWRESRSLIKAIVGGNLRLVEPLLDLWSLPLSYQFFCLLLLVSLAAWPLKVYSLLGIFIIFYYLWRGITLLKRPKWEIIAFVIGLPGYLFNKIRLLPFIVRAAWSREWRRTERDD